MPIPPRRMLPAAVLAAVLFTFSLPALAVAHSRAHWSVAVNNPAGSTPAHGVIGLRATIRGRVRITRVRLVVDGRVVATDRRSPYAFALDSRAYANSVHTI